MKVLFIITDEEKLDSHLIKNSNLDTFLPLGIAQLCSVLEKAGHIVKVKDMRQAGKKNFSEIFALIDDFKPDILSLSTYFFSYKKILEYAKSIKSRYVLPIFVGGTYPALYPITIFENKDIYELFSKSAHIDFIVEGEGEIVLPLLLNAIENKLTLEGIEGITYRKGKNVSRNAGLPLVRDLDELPYPDFESVGIFNYRPLPKNYKAWPVLPLLTSRGCTWGKCEFCWQSRLKGYYRRMSAKRVVEMIKHYKKKYAIKEVHFWDDTFFDSREWILSFCRLMQEKDINIIWSCHERVSMVSEEIISQMKKAGCWQILFGIESGNQQILNSINKGITLKQSVSAVKLAKKYGIEARASFIIGLPGENPEITEETVNFSRRLDADITQFSFFTPYPGTRLYEKINRNKRIDKNFGKYSECKVVYVPEDYKSKKEIEKKYEDAYMTTYLSPKYIFRSIKRIRSTEDIRRHFSGLKTILKRVFGSKSG